MPENTIPAFLKAVELGVTTLEMDVVITKDKKVLVSHEPWLNSEICFDENGNEIKKSDEKSFNIYKMNYDEISICDCGSKFYSRFPEQQKIKVIKPLLEHVIDSVENYCNVHNLPHLFYNIETKCTPKGDLIFHPNPEEFTDLLVNVLKIKKIEDRSIIQSFDTRTLQYAHKKYPEVHLALLVENNSSAEKNLTKLGFVPDIYSPAKERVNKKLVKFCKEKT
jgi:glycerophosphoryl diester phosphodiesterase